MIFISMFFSKGGQFIELFRLQARKLLAGKAERCYKKRKAAAGTVNGTRSGRVYWSAVEVNQGAWTAA
jgi:hypothetical protein